MEKMLNNYLDKVDKYLRPMPASERADIVKEIQSQILELQDDGLSAEEIISRLGDPKELAKAYLGDALESTSGFSIGRLLTVCAFYSVVSFSGMCVIPSLIIIAPVFIICAIAVPIASAIKLIDYIFSLGIPYAQNIHIVFFGLKLNPAWEFLIALVTGILLYLAGKAAWKLLVFYCKAVSKTKRKLEV